jgi:hypothetical protein
MDSKIDIMHSNMDAFTSNVRKELAEYKTTLQTEKSRKTWQFLTLVSLSNDREASKLILGESCLQLS